MAQASARYAGTARPRRGRSRAPGWRGNWDRSSTRPTTISGQSGGYFVWKGCPGKARDSIARPGCERPGALEVNRVVFKPPEQRHVGGTEQQSQRGRQRQYAQEGRQHERPSLAATGEETHRFASTRLRIDHAGIPGKHRRCARVSHPGYRVAPAPATSSSVKHVCPRAVVSGDGGRAAPIRGHADWAGHVRVRREGARALRRNRRRRRMASMHSQSCGTCTPIRVGPHDASQWATYGWSNAPSVTPCQPGTERKPCRSFRYVVVANPPGTSSAGC
jgi:hypothetical protein